MKKVRINRANWACGGRYSKRDPINYKGNMLYNEETNGMCCLGFAANQLCEIPIDLLKNQAYPSSLGIIGVTKNVNDPAVSFGFDSLDELRAFERQAVNINDNPKLSYARREKQILKLFKKYNIDVQFYGEYTK